MKRDFIWKRVLLRDLQFRCNYLLVAYEILMIFNPLFFSSNKR
jgi:hypothetical protein